MKKEIKETIEVYNKFAKQYSDYTFHKIAQFPLNNFVSMLPKKAKVLDVGCGSGRDVAYMMEDNLDIIGIDAAENMILEAKKRVPKGKFKVMDMFKIDFKDNTFDGIWNHATFCHCHKSDALELLHEYKRVMKHNGVLYLGLREGEGEKMVSYDQSGNLPKFFAFYMMEELVQLLKKAGFEIINAYSERENNYNWLNVFARSIK